MSKNVIVAAPTFVKNSSGTTFKMNKYLLILLAGIVFSCAPHENLPEGMWRVNDKFYNATYQISASKQGIKSQILSYDDGTSKYTYQGGEKHYFFENLRYQKNGQYAIDGTSGATTKKAKKHVPKKTLVKVKNNDTLEVTTYLMSQPMKEHWVRLRGK